MTTRTPLKVVSYLAPNWFGFYQAVTEFLSRVLAQDVQLVQGQSDPLDDPALLHDQLDLAFICGLPFGRYCQIAPYQLQALVAPVMQAPRYHNQPIYFADVIVKASSGFTDLERLQGSTFCYNDRGSNSGYHLVQQRLQHDEVLQPVFDAAIASGSHQQSIRWVLAGQADWAAIDSTVLEQALRDAPELVQQLRVVASIGPSPMPPLVAATHLGKEVIDRIQAAMLQPDANLQAAMQRMTVQRYAAVKSADYAVFNNRLAVMEW
ncbi:MAG: PhnD/SsuA/transferrin family substrate-binding protein [Tildeniella nuda ZEHNDER 1965/U140]|jgi:phosphonate transport system substrate-binding protein|nr:PhnD/SsuA/transferrin family substrate-binding protein [Tildeniella nuda ZEHNDER 1965/U140]